MLPDQYRHILVHHNIRLTTINNTTLTDDLFIKWFADGVRVESVDKSLWQSHDVLHVPKQCFHVLGGQRRRRRRRSRKERFETKLQAGAVVYFRWVEFWDYFVTSFTEFLRQLLLADWRLYWCYVICCSSHTQIGSITFTTNVTLLCRSFTSSSLVYCCFQQVSDMHSYLLSCLHLDLSEIKSFSCQ